MYDPLLLSMRNYRQSLVALSLTHKGLPTANTDRRIMEQVPNIARAELDDRQLALLWGELQLMLVECDGAGVWAQLRNAVATSLVALLKRPEFVELQPLFVREIYPAIANSVNRSRDARMQVTIEITTRLRTLATLPSFSGQRWLLQQIADMQYPRFGTSGWRARMGVDFTWARATAVAQAIMDYIKSNGLANMPLTIGYDSRINGDKVAGIVAEVALANGIDVQLASRDTPSPALIFHITETLGVANNAGLINCTPSHNPVKDPARRTYLGTEYHGIRYNMPHGAVAPGSTTDAIGRRAMELLLEDIVVPVAQHRGKLRYFDTLEAYIDLALKHLDQTITLPNGTQANTLALMRKFWGASNAMIVIDEMHSASRGYLRRACDKLDIRYTVIHGEKDPLLGDLMYANPEPPHIAGCQKKVRDLSGEFPRIIGLGFDTDSDRFGVVDELGNSVNTNKVLPMLAEYLLTATYTGKPGMIIRNMCTTRMLDRIAEAYKDRVIPPTDIDAVVRHATASNYKLMLGEATRMSGFYSIVVPVGFKYIAETIMGELESEMKAGERDPAKIQTLFHDCLNKLMLAGEESNGFTSRGHTPDKDGLWGALLTLQMLAVRGELLQDLWAELTHKYGHLYNVRRDVEAPNAAKTALVNSYLDRYEEMNKDMGPEADQQMCGLIPVYCGGVRDELVEIVYRDKQRQESFLTIRASGTEPINRFYIESPDDKLRDAMRQATGEQLERLILEEINAATSIDSVVELLQSVELPPEDGEDLPATFTLRIVEPAKAKISSLAVDIVVALAVADAKLAENNPAKAGSLIS